MSKLDRRAFVRLLGGGAAGLVVFGCEDSGGSAAPTTSTGSTSTLVSGVDVPDPTDHLITRWRQDPFSRGSYSYLARGAQPEDRTVLAEPIGDRVFFAGEATHRVYPALVHGGYLSGRRAATEVRMSGASSAIVIGAGAAGLAAAGLLAEDGIETTILEARDRTGGRVHSDRSLGSTVDLGASWIQGVGGNPVTDLADRFDIERARSDYRNLVVRDGQGRFIDRNDVPDPWWVVADVELEYAADVEQLSPGAYDEGGLGSGGDVVFPAGYDQVTDALAEGLDIRLEQTVLAISYDEDGVTIMTIDGETRTEVVIVTVPLGVLKAGDIIFDPPLPADKLGAIDRLGMGVLDKVYFKFDEPFWDRDVEFFGYLGPDLDRFAYWVNMTPYTGAPILLAFHGGSAADTIELMTDHDIIAEGVRTLRLMFG